MVLNSETSECELDETGKERTHGVTSRSIGKWGFEGHGLGARLTSASLENRALGNT